MRHQAFAYRFAHKKGQVVLSFAELPAITSTLPEDQFSQMSRDEKIRHAVNAAAAFFRKREASGKTIKMRHTPAKFQAEGSIIIGLDRWSALLQKAAPPKTRQRALDPSMPKQ